MSQEAVEVNPGEDVFVSCNVSGHPTPSLLWISNTGHPLVRHTHKNTHTHIQKNKTNDHTQTTFIDQFCVTLCPEL